MSVHPRAAMDPWQEEQMTALLWSFEELARLCGHQDRRVKGWAAGRMRRLYPKEAGPLMVGLLNDRNGSVAAKAAAYFCDDPDRNFADALLAAFRKSSGIVAKHLAHALALMKDDRLLDAVRDKHARIPGADPADFAGVLMNVALLGTDESQRYVEDALRHLDSFGDFKEMAAGAFFNANIEAGTDIGKLLLFAYHSGVSGYVPALLAEIANRAGIWCPVDVLAGKSGKGKASKVLAGEVEASLALLARTGCDAGNAIEKLLKKRRFDEILEEAERTALAIQQAKKAGARRGGLSPLAGGEGCPVLSLRRPGRPKGNRRGGPRGAEGDRGRDCHHRSCLPRGVPVPHRAESGDPRRRCGARSLLRGQARCAPG